LNFYISIIKICIRLGLVVIIMRPNSKSSSRTKKNKTRKCSGCRNPLPDYCKTKTCKKCRERGAAVRKATRENKIECNAIKDSGEKCTNKVSPKCGNKFCEKHIKEWKELKQTGGKEVRRCNSRTQCDPKNPGVKAILPEGYLFKKCENCLARDRVKDKNLRDSKKDLNDVVRVENPTMRICPQCSVREVYNIEDMGLKKDGTRSHLCQHHFEQSQKNDTKRNSTEKRKLYKKEYEYKPERKEYKCQWRQKNPDKVYKYYTGYRARKLKDDPVAYHKKAAENAKKWRDKNPDKVEYMRLKKKKNPKVLYSSYLLRSNYCGNDFELSFEEFEKIVTSKCYYCNVPYKEFLLGVDQLECSKGYTKTNSIPCCEMCNMMKNTLNEATFILMCAHIARHNNIIKIESLYPKIFNNYKSKGYEGYKRRAAKKNLEFEITEEEFDKMVNEDPCHICGRHTNDKHRNGIDRIDNLLGYILSNCKSCCGDCNYLKGEYIYIDFIIQCSFVTFHHTKRLDELVKIWTPSKFLVTNELKKSLTYERKKELQEQIKLIRHERTMSTKTPEAIEKRANEIKQQKQLLTKTQKKSINKNNDSDTDDDVNDENDESDNDDDVNDESDNDESDNDDESDSDVNNESNSDVENDRMIMTKIINKCS